MSKSESSDDLLRSVEEAIQNSKEKMLAFYRAKTVPEIKESILDLDDEMLDWLCEKLAMETEDYEICQAVFEVKKERLKNGWNAKAEEDVDEDELLEEAKRQKNITPKQHGAAMLKMLDIGSSAFDKYFELINNPDSTKEEIDAGAIEASNALKNSRREFDEIDKIFQEQKK